MFQVWVLGCSSATPAFGRHLSAQVVEHHQHLMLIDCGEGTQFQMNRYRLRLHRLDVVFVSHMHGDHVFGLPGLLTSLSMLGRNKPLHLVGPVGIKQWLESTFSASYSTLLYPIIYTELEPVDSPQQVYETSHLVVECFPLYHRVPCFGYRFAEKPKKRKLMIHLVRQANIPKEYFHLVKQGHSFYLEDNWIDAQQFLGAPDPSFSYAYCSDTRYAPEIVPFITDTTLLYHEATFLSTLQNNATATAHSTAAEAAQMALQANVAQLLIGHFSARYPDLKAHLAEAQQIFPATELAMEGKCYAIALNITSEPEDQAITDLPID
jgi:ribonuclease Z